MRIRSIGAVITGAAKATFRELTAVRRQCRWSTDNFGRRGAPGSATSTRLLVGEPRMHPGLCRPMPESSAWATSNHSEAVRNESARRCRCVRLPQAQLAHACSATAPLVLPVATL